MKKIKDQIVEREYIFKNVLTLLKHADAEQHVLTPKSSLPAGSNNLKT